MTVDAQRDLFGARVGEYELPAVLTFPGSTCRSCGAAIVWGKTPASKAVPLSVAAIETRDGVRYALSHFADCPDAKKWSKR